MIVARLFRGFGDTLDIHELDSGKYAFDVTVQGVSDNANWPEVFDTFNEAITFAQRHHWQNLNGSLIKRPMKEEGR